MLNLLTLGIAAVGRLVAGLDVFNAHSIEPISPRCTLTITIFQLSLKVQSL